MLYFQRFFFFSSLHYLSVSAWLFIGVLDVIFSTHLMVISSSSFKVNTACLVCYGFDSVLFKSFGKYIHFHVILNSCCHIQVWIYVCDYHKIYHKTTWNDFNVFHNSILMFCCWAFAKLIVAGCVQEKSLFHPNSSSKRAHITQREIVGIGKKIPSLFLWRQDDVNNFQRANIPVMKMINNRELAVVVVFIFEMYIFPSQCKHLRTNRSAS